ncbi:hypothetical protein CONPUDRAFT_165681 [Coniophora puteana RWD-64-598 SS2]|uniref:C2H2-type domain-containing protein n=1 Tax=Coniophora puteana (strain RWD-64-598) TaxID=741705 RepID=A0A5M3MR81_CONPW|nr:uncharacterized protein CONPUDRAFT_165681 [Coniophora puteana RWD-64-598 SS2]EIW81576.1 hypothetical protein CONPUDRAFT_165681 [Coniophora puteana RWD-64-598 SS2]
MAYPEVPALPASTRPAYAPPKFARKPYAQDSATNSETSSRASPCPSHPELTIEKSKSAQNGSAKFASPLSPSSLQQLQPHATTAPMTPAKRKRTYACPYPDCGETFTRKMDRSRHMQHACRSESAEAQAARREHPAPVWHCPVCGKVLSRRDATERHILKGTCVKGRCGMCGDRMTERAIKGHMDDMGKGNMKCFSAKLATKAAKKSKKRKLEDKEDEEEELEVEVVLGEDELEDELESEDGGEGSQDKKAAVKDEGKFGNE